jgi:hypothetical protein
MPITPFLDGEAFDPEQIKSMSWALEEVCNALHVCDESSREVVAVRIIELARSGVHAGIALRDRVLREAEWLSRADEAPTAPWHHRAQLL